MSLSVIEYIEEFIDYLNQEFNKEVYNCLKNEGYTPKEIYGSSTWIDRKKYLTRSEGFLFDSFVESVISDFIHKYSLHLEVIDIRCGIEQITFILDDIVYKISSTNVAKSISNLREELQLKYRELFPKYNFIKFYCGCYIFTQERVNGHEDSTSYIAKCQTKGINTDSIGWGCFNDLGIVAALALEYDVDFVRELNQELQDSGFAFDIHSGNWGINTVGKIRIYDPIYDGEYSYW